MISSGNQYLAALKGNQPSLYKKVVAHFNPEATTFEINKGHGRIEKRMMSYICWCFNPYLSEWLSGFQLITMVLLPVHCLNAKEQM